MNLIEEKKIQVVILGKHLNTGIKVERLKYVADFNSQAQGVFEQGEIEKIINHQNIRKEKLAEKKEFFIEILRAKESLTSVKAKEEELERLKNILEKPRKEKNLRPVKKKKSFLNKLFNW